MLTETSIYYCSVLPVIPHLVSPIVTLSFARHYLPIRANQSYLSPPIAHLGRREDSSEGNSSMSEGAAVVIMCFDCGQGGQREVR